MVVAVGVAGDRVAGVLAALVALVTTVGRMITDVLDLDECRSEPTPSARTDRPSLDRDGNVTWRGAARAADAQAAGQCPAADARRAWYYEEPSRVRVNAVHFTPSARTAWHSHGMGQTLYVTEGRGFVQSRGGEVVAIAPGDVVNTPADEWHRHGAQPDHFMTHLSVTEAAGDERPETVWGDHVSDAEYGR